jgi:Protein of unknown function (DUF4089)
MNDIEARDYVRASAAVLGLPLDDAQVVRVALHLQRTAAMARMLDALDLAPDVEQAEIYRPGPPPVQATQG